MASVFAPVLILAVPIFDMIVVLIIRRRLGQRLWEGDVNHFTHRLIRLGMSPTKAVLFVYFVALIIGVGATMLKSLSWPSAVLLFCQAGATFCVIAILMAISRD